MGETLLKQIADGYDGNAYKHQLRLSTYLHSSYSVPKKSTQQEEKTSQMNPGTKAVDLNLAASPPERLRSDPPSVPFWIYFPF